MKSAATKPTSGNLGVNSGASKAQGVALLNAHDDLYDRARQLRALAETLYGDSTFGNYSREIQEDVLSLVASLARDVYDRVEEIMGLKEAGDPA